MKNITTNIAKVALAAGVFLSFAAVASAWTGPTAAAPAGNVPAPINASSTGQTKTGDFTSNGILEGVTGLMVDGGSALVGHVDIGPYDCIYHGGTISTCGGVITGGGSSSGLDQHFAMKSTKSIVADVFNALNPATAYAMGTPSTDALHVNGNTSITGTLQVNGATVCFTSACGPLHLSGTDTASPLMRLGTNAVTFDNDQGGSMELGANNTTSNASGHVPYIDFHYGTGTVQDYNTRIINGADNVLNFQTNSGGNVMDIDGNKLMVNGGDSTSLPAHPRSLVDLWGGQLDITGIDHNGTATMGSLGGIAYFGNNTLANAIAVGSDQNVGIGTGSAAPAAKLDVNGNINANAESHFSTGVYSDPESGVAAAIKATSIATGSLYIPGELPIYLSSCNTGGLVTENSGCGSGTSNGAPLGYLIPAAAPAPLGAHITGMTLGTPDYTHNVVPGTVSFSIDGSNGYTVTNTTVYTQSGSHTDSVNLGSGLSLGNHTVTFDSSHGGNFICSPTAGYTTGYDIWVKVTGTSVGGGAAPTYTSPHYTTGVPPC